MAERIKVLIQKRGTLKAQITNFRKFINENKNKDVSVENITRRTEKFNKMFASFDEMSDELELLDEKNAEAHATARAEIEEDYFIILDIADEIQKKAVSRNHVTVSGNQVTVSENHSTVSGDQVTVSGDQVMVSESAGTSSEIDNRTATNQTQKRRIRLPEAKVPTFSGKYEDWLAFKDSFTSLIDEQADLSNVEKLQYLKGFVADAAYDSIKGLATTDDNYERAWTILKDTYADTRQIIARHLTIILSLPIQTRESAEGLRKLANDTRQNLESLASLDVIIPDPILVQNIELKLHKNTVEKWDETLKFGVFPTLEEMLNFLNKTATRLSKRETASAQNISEPPQFKNNPFQQKKKKKGAKQTFFTTSAYQCPVCKEAHTLYRCKSFKDSPIKKRVEIVKGTSVCLICLREHVNKPCKFSKCMVCDRKENYMLHEHSSSSNQD